MRSTTFQLLLWQIGIVTIVVALFGAGNYILSTNQLSNQIDERNELVLKRMSNALTIPLWNLDTDVIAKVATEQKGAENISRLRITDNFGEVLVSLGELNSTLEYRMSDIDVVYKDNVIGSIEISVDVQQLAFAQKTAISLTNLIALIVIFTIVITTYLLMHRLVKKPLDKLIQGFEGISKGDLEYRLPDSHSRDIHTIYQSFNSMASDLKKAKEELAYHYETLESEVQTRTKELHATLSVLEEKKEELERMNKVFVDRELKMVDMKEKFRESESDEE
jgi:methyl-accepting chemotaxis protein